tara:strand:- start:96 stop:551 length:456 start_codon:yes stop_codon:yes gene_type:complete
VIKISISLALIVLDLLSKLFIFNYINLNSSISVFPFMDLIHIHNYGISFGLFSGILPPWFINLISFVVTLFVFYLMIKATKKIEKLGLLLIIIGALSNIFDRLINNYVIDFIYFNYKDFYWPAFNFADIYITIGVIMIFYELYNDIVKKYK